MAVEFPANNFFRTNQNYAHSECTRGEQGAAYLGPGAVVTAHCIHGDRQHERNAGEKLFFCDFDDFAALVLAALRAGAMGEFRLVAVGALGHAGHTEVIMSAAGGSPALGVSAFRIRHLLRPFVLCDLQVAERRPPVVKLFCPAITVARIPVFSTLRANAGTIFAAKCVHRKRQQNMLPEDIGQLDAATLIKPDLRLTVVNVHLVRLRSFRSRTVKQVKRPVQREVNRFQAPVALQIDIHIQLATDPDLAKSIVEKFGFAVGMKIANLGQRRVAEVDFARRKVLIKFDLPELELL